MIAQVAFFCREPQCGAGQRSDIATLMRCSPEEEEMRGRAARRRRVRAGATGACVPRAVARLIRLPARAACPSFLLPSSTSILCHDGMRISASLVRPSLTPATVMLMLRQEVCLPALLIDEEEG